MSETFNEYYTRVSSEARRKALEEVRCKNCKYWFPNKNFMEDSTFYYCSKLGVDMDVDDFCSRGEKRDE